MPALSSQLKPPPNEARELGGTPTGTFSDNSTGLWFPSSAPKPVKSTWQQSHSLIEQCCPAKMLPWWSEERWVSGGFVLEGCGSYCSWWKFSKFSQTNAHHCLSVWLWFISTAPNSHCREFYLTTVRNPSEDISNV